MKTIAALLLMGMVSSIFLNRQDLLRGAPKTEGVEDLSQGKIEVLSGSPQVEQQAVAQQVVEQAAPQGLMFTQDAPVADDGQFQASSDSEAMFADQAPVDDQAAPVEAQAAPVEAQAAPVEAQAAPVEAQAVQAAPAESQAAPMDAPLQGSDDPNQPIVIPVDAVIENGNSTIRPRINVLLYGKIPEKMPMINLKLSVGKDFLKNFDENGNPKPGFAITPDMISTESVPAGMPREDQPVYTQVNPVASPQPQTSVINVGEGRTLVEIIRSRPMGTGRPAVVNMNSAQSSNGKAAYSQPGVVQAQPKIQAHNLPSAQPAAFARPAVQQQAPAPVAPKPVAAAQTPYPLQASLRRNQCSPVPKIGHPVLLVSKLFQSLRNMFAGEAFNKKLIFDQQVKGVYYHVYKVVVEGSAPQFYGLSYDSNTQQILNFTTSPDLFAITTQLGIAQVNADDEYICGDLSKVFRGEPERKPTVLFNVGDAK